MIFKSITLKNFRQYRGENTILFSTDLERNVTVVLGVNTSGKTTLVQAFLWCLYGTTSFKTKDYLNSELGNDIVPNTEVTVSVSVVLEHSGNEYFIERSLIVSKNENGNLRPSSQRLKISYKDSTGNTQWVSSNEKKQKDVIEGILSEELSDYFFFDGERIEEISDKKNVVNAVEGLMGINILGAAIRHLDPKPTIASSVPGRLRKELDVGSDSRSSSLGDTIDKLSESIIKNKNRIEIVSQEIETFSKKKEELGQRLLGTKEVSEKQKQRQSLENDIRNYKNTVISFKTRLLSDFNRDYFPFFAGPLLKKALEVIASAKEDPQGIPAMHSSSIDYIIKRQRCICGCDLSKNQGAVDNILYERGLLPPQHIGADVSKCKTMCLMYAKQTAGVHEEIFNSYTEMLRYEATIDEKAEDLKQINEEIGKMRDINVSAIEADYQSADRIFQAKLQEKGRLEATIDMAKKQIEECEKERDSLAAKNEKNSLIRKEIRYAEAVYNWFKEEYDKSEKEVREQLTESINRFFSEIYHGNRKVTLDVNYKINLKTELKDKDIVTDESKGLEAVKNFSFISGLVDLAKRKAQHNSGNDESFNAIEPYPIVMDAPFSNVDEIHISNIASVLPQAAEQVILIVMKKDWDYAKQKMQHKVGASYVIEKVNNSETYSVIRREDNV